MCYTGAKKLTLGRWGSVGGWSSVWGLALGVALRGWGRVAAILRLGVGGGRGWGGSGGVAVPPIAPCSSAAAAATTAAPTGIPTTVIVLCGEIGGV